MRNFAVLFVAALLAVIAPAASNAQQESQNLIFSAKASGETNIVEARVDPGALNAASEQAHLADRVLMQAIATNDGTTATNLLASEFTWIDRDGRSRTKSDLLDRIVLLSAGPDTNLAVSVYGRVALVTGTHALIPDGAEAFFTRVWVRQGFDWRLLLYQETAPGDFSARDRTQRSSYAAAGHMRQSLQFAALQAPLARRPGDRHLFHGRRKSAL